MFDQRVKKSMTPQLVHELCVNLGVNRPFYPHQPFSTSKSETDRAGQRAGSETKRGTRELRCEYVGARISRRVKERARGGIKRRREKQKEVEESELLFPVTPGQSCRSPPVIELH